MEVLLCPAPGSIMHAESQNRGFEAIWPRSGWTQREPSAAKARMVEQVRDMQERVRRYADTQGGIENLTTEDIYDFLAKDSPWSLQMVNLYRCVAHSMD